MKKTISSISIALLMAIGVFNYAVSQDTTESTATDSVAEEMVDSPSSISNQANEDDSEVSQPIDEVVELDFVQTLKQKYIEGDPFWMTPVLICLIIGLALSIERIVYLNLSTINTRKFLDDVETALKNKGVEAAKDICRNTRGPIASIFYQGLDRSDEGIEMVEKSVVSYGGVQMGLLEKGLSWLSLFIALAPMLGFLGTVIGMIFAFDKIVSDGQVSPTTVAGGIKVALLTTVFGLITAIILQIFYNYITSKVDSLVNSMEDATISLVDILIDNKQMSGSNNTAAE